MNYDSTDPDLDLIQIADMLRDELAQGRISWTDVAPWWRKRLDRRKRPDPLLTDSLDGLPGLRAPRPTKVSEQPRSWWRLELPRWFRLRA